MQAAPAFDLEEWMPVIRKLVALLLAALATYGAGSIEDSVNGELQATVSAATEGIRAGDEVTFKVRTFGLRAEEGRETWDFGDGSKPAHTRSDGNADQHARDGYAVTTHRYASPGRYLVTVSRTNDRGQRATGRLHVMVAPRADAKGDAR